MGLRVGNVDFRRDGPALSVEDGVRALINAHVGVSKVWGGV